MASKRSPRRLTPEGGLIKLRAVGTSAQWIWVQTCPEPECDCRAAFVIVSRVDRDALLVAAATAKTMMDDGLGMDSIEERVGDDCAAFELDIDTAEARRVKHGRCLPLTKRFPWLRDVLECIDGEILEQIGKLWYRVKGQSDPEATSQKPVNVVGWEPGDEVSWQEAYFGVREDKFVIDGRTCEAVELYCVMPDCDCGRVRVRFDDIEIEEPTFIGLVTIERSGATTLETDKGPSDLLDRLWATYQTRHPAYRERHAQRYPRMKEFGKILLAHHPAQSAAKVSRNEPCPCGSGKKHKKCCLQKSSVSSTGSA